jgi:hypothetical protein
LTIEVYLIYHTRNIAFVEVALVSERWIVVSQIHLTKWTKPSTPVLSDIDDSENHFN